MPLMAQIMIWQNPETGEISAEVPHGGLRRKINLPDDKSLWGDIIEGELSYSSTWIKEQNRHKNELELIEKKRLAEITFKRSWDRHHQIWDTAASRANQGPDFANEKFGPRNRNQKKKITIKDLIEI